MSARKKAVVVPLNGVRVLEPASFTRVVTMTKSALQTSSLAEKKVFTLKQMITFYIWVGNSCGLCICLKDNPLKLGK